MNVGKVLLLATQLQVHAKKRVGQAQKCTKTTWRNLKATS